MDTTPHRVSQILILGFVCLSLVVPPDIHSTVAEIGAHDFPVSIDARHADQEAHFEHSAVEVRSACAACTLTQRSEAASLMLFGGAQRLPRLGILLPSDPYRLASRPDCYAPSRGPPLL